MAVIDVLFPALGTTLPTDHAYPLYGALSRLVPAIHNGPVAIRFTALDGEYTGNGRLRLHARSCLRLRLPTESIPLVLPLAGKALSIDDCKVRLGVPRVAALVPATSLASHIVTFKNSLDPDKFLSVAREKLSELGIAGEPGIPTILTGPRQGEPRRKVLRIKGCSVVGYSLLVSGLTAEDSIKLQEEGLGGRRRMGCGLFVALPQGERS